MTKRYYLDTCIWRDHYENRISKKGNDLGFYATNFLKKVLEKRHKILFSSLTYSEMKIHYALKEIDNMFNLLFKAGILEKVEISDVQILEALKISVELNIPKNDVLHAILARDGNACIVTQDKHFNYLRYLVKVISPDEV